MQLMEKLASHLAKRPAELRRLKEKGRKIVGYFPGDYVPEELIYASGAIPVCLCQGGDPRPLGVALSATTRFICPFARALVGDKMLGNQPFYELIDLLAVPVVCQHLRRTADIWQHHSGPPVFRLGVPLEYDSEAGMQYYTERLESLKERLQNLTDTVITDASLNRAIEQSNALRGLLRKISLLRKASPSPISTINFIKLNHASFYAAPDLMIDLMSSLSNELEKRAGDKAKDDSPRLLITGPNIASGDYKVLEVAGELGAQIVAEEVFEGVRYYWSDVTLGSSPIRALADKYLQNRVPAGVMPSAAPRRYEFISKLAKEFNVDGIIWYQLLFCETYDVESYFFAQKMKQAGIPVLKLQSDYDILDRGSIKTRMEAFIETLKKGAVQ